MQVSFADATVKRLCATQESLIRVFGELWTSVKLCLTVLAAAETLANVATFAAVTVRCVYQAGGGVVEFLIGHGTVQLRVRALDADASNEGPDSPRDPLTLVRAVSVVSVTQAAAVTAS